VKPTLTLLTALLLAPLAALHASTWYVSPGGSDTNSGLTAELPLRSIPHAIELSTRTLGPGPLSQPVNIVLMEGTHLLDEPVNFTLSNAWPLSIKAAPGAKPVVTGARRLGGWNAGEVPTTGAPCLVTELPEVRSGAWDFRQLFVNGRRAQRPRLPREGYSRVEQLIPSEEGRNLSTAHKDRFVFREGDIRPWTNQGDVNALVLHYWQHAWLPLTNVDLPARTAYFKWGTVMPLVHSHPSHGVADWIKQETPYPHQTWYLGASYYMDNVFEELREPGQWYLDRPAGKLYYIPLPGESAASLEAWAPRLTNSFTFQGDWRKGAFLTGLTIEGISFRHSEIDHQAHRGTGNWWGNYGPSLLIFSGTRKVAVRDCVFESLGECAIDLAYGNAEVELSGNRFHDLGSGAIKAVGTWRENTPEENEQGRLTQLRVTDNDISGYGRVFPGSVALIVEKPTRSVLAHNRITDGYFTAINCSGGSMDNEDVFRTFDTLIANNHIHDIGEASMPCSNDLGGIYVHGNMIGCVIRGNVVSNVQCSVYGGNGIYIDDCASYLRIEDNLVRDTMDALNIKGRRSQIRNNILGPCGRSLARRASGKTYENDMACIESNLLITTNGALFHFQTGTAPTNTGFFPRGNLIASTTSHLEVGVDGSYGAHDRMIPYGEWCASTGNGAKDTVLPGPFPGPEGWPKAITPGSIYTRHGMRPCSFETAGPRPREQRAPVPFLTTRSEGGPEHQEAIEYAKRILAERSAKNAPKPDVSTHRE